MLSGWETYRRQMGEEKRVLCRVSEMKIDPIFLTFFFQVPPTAFFCVSLFLTPSQTPTRADSCPCCLSPLPLAHAHPAVHSFAASVSTRLARPPPTSQPATTKTEQPQRNHSREHHRTASGIQHRRQSDTRSQRPAGGSKRRHL